MRGQSCPHENHQAGWLRKTGVGEGGIEWPAVIKACKASGTRHFIVEQDDCPITNEPFKSMRISFENLQALGL